MRYTKWGGKRHWRFVAEPLGSDEHGWWYGCPAGTSMRRGLEEPVIVDYDFIVLVPVAGWWIASWNGEGHRNVAVYVDVTTEPVRVDGLVEAVDLDLDVIRLRDGGVELLDEDEFEEHQVLYGYPAEVITQARASADELLEMIAQRHEPFGEAGDAWLARFVTSR
ncbi:DUF402 domain-containing protein [Actinoplanes sp. NPDC026619]|uniref:DUF402 domain-containing protein n=1 Tax=Actinoplanes sp. NPDC026619 TaxID=3155798 RepID=UPI0033C60521